MKTSRSTKNRWKSTALAALVASGAGLWIADAHALALGKLTVQSALGEPLRAEIDLPEISGAEFDSLKANPASAEAFRTAGYDYNPTLQGLNIEVLRRPDGRAYLRLRSDRVVNDPFLDLILEANWSSGRIVRDYTLLFDPAGTHPAPPGIVTAPLAAASAGVQTTLPPRAQTVPTPPATEAQAAQPRPVATAPRPSPPPAVKPAAPASPKPTPSGNTLTVKPGDTAGRIASSIKPANVSLDQMLVALMRANPDAFLRGNVNRLRAGVVLDLPDSAAAEAIPADEARQTIVAQSRDFNDFRRKLASNAPKVTVAPAERAASGKVQTEVEEKKPGAAAPDKLTLSKGALQAQANGKTPEERIAEEKQAKAQSERLAELNKNISDLTKISESTKPAGAAAPVPPAAAPATAGGPSAPATPAVLPAPPAASTAPAAPAPAPAAKPAPTVPPKVPPVPPPPPEDPGILGMLEDNPMIPAAGGGILALLAGLGLYRFMKRRRSAHVDSSFLESRLQPDSFFGASGGQRVDTSDSSSGSSSMAYSPSQLDAGDVDPVAEADVYLAYGRDLQAEEILKEALKINPSRVAIHAKLLEIHAKRKDVPAFNALAMEAFKLTQGSGPEWDRIRELGRELDPSNPLYGAQPSAPATDSAPPEAPAGQPAAGNLDLDLDLDLPLDDPAPAPAAPAAPMADPFADLNLDLDPVAAAPNPVPEPPVAEPPPPPPAAPAAPAAEASAALSDDFSIDLDHELDFPSAKPTEPAGLGAQAGDQADAHDSGMIEFDLDSLTLDLDGTLPPADKPAAAAPSEDDWAHSAKALEEDDLDAQAEDPLATKLALAEEFNAIGDADGARALIEEVIAEASGPLKSKAQRLLAQLD